MFSLRLGAGLLAMALAISVTITARPAVAASKAEINRDVDAALAILYAKDPDARTLTSRAKAVLVFPSIVKAGFLFGAQYGEGALRATHLGVWLFHAAISLCFIAIIPRSYFVHLITTPLNIFFSKLTPRGEIRKIDNIEEAESLGVPVAFHGIQMAYQEHLGRRFMDNFVMAHAVAHPLEQMMALGSLLTGGVFERFPGLKAAFLEGSCSWVPWWLWTLDERVEKFGDEERFRLSMRPSEYFHRNCWVSVDPDEDVVRHALPSMGDDNIVISTDWPHDDSAYPRAVDTFLALAGVSGASKKKILWDNCARLYGLD